MAKRKHKLYTKVDSADVQGKGSWVKLKTPTFSDYGDMMSPAVVEDGTDTEAGANDRMDKMKIGFTMLKKSIVGWNWVDDDDKPLPNPQDNPEVVESLPLQEMMFLLAALDLEGLTATKKK